MQKKIRMMKNIFSENERIAMEIRRKLDRTGLFMVNVLGSPGTGKTSVITALIKALKPMPSVVIEGDVESDIDTVALKKKGIKAFQINTRGGCHLDSPMIDKVLKSGWFRTEIPQIFPDQGAGRSGYKGILFVENIGNLICPAEFDLGEHFRLLISSTTEGSDKPYKYPLMFEKAHVVTINKSDLSKKTGFKLGYFTKGVKRLNKKAPIVQVSAITGKGIKELADFLRRSAG